MYHGAYAYETDDDNDDDDDGDVKALEKEEQFPELEFRSHYNSFLPNLWVMV